MIKTRRRILAAKPEAVEGVAEALLAANAGIIALDVKWNPDITMLQRLAALPTLSKLKKIPGLKLAHISFKAELMGTGTVYSDLNLPPIDPFLRACGFAATLDVTPGVEKVTYKPATIGVPCLTMGAYTDGIRKLLSGARGTVKFNAETGGQVFAEFDFLGAYHPVTDTPMLAPSFSTLIPPLLLDANILLDAFGPVLNSISIDMGNKLAPRKNASAASGYQSFMLTDRDPAGKFDPEMEAVLSYDWYGRWAAGTSTALSIGPIGTEQYNRVKLTAPALVPTKTSEGDREGLEIADTDFQLAGNVGDDELVIEFS